MPNRPNKILQMQLGRLLRYYLCDQALSQRFRQETASNSQTVHVSRDINDC